MDLLLSCKGLTTLCQFNYGISDISLCPNCIYDVNLKKSAGKYKDGGPIPFLIGRICPYCNGEGSYGKEKSDLDYLAVIWDYKKWINSSINIKNPEGYIETICRKNLLKKIKGCKDMTVVLDRDKTNPTFSLYGEPTPAGLGDNNYIFCFWQKIGDSKLLNKEAFVSQITFNEDPNSSVDTPTQTQAETFIENPI
jgi:hypothetical protein